VYSGPSAACRVPTGQTTLETWRLEAGYEVSYSPSYVVWSGRKVEYACMYLLTTWYPNDDLREVTGTDRLP